MTTPTKEEIEKIKKEICGKLGISYSVLFGKKQPEIGKDLGEDNGKQKRN